MSDSRRSVGSIKGATTVHPSYTLKMGGQRQDANLGKLGNTSGSDGRPVNGSTLKPVKTPQHNVMSAKVSKPGFSKGESFAKKPINGGIHV